MHGVCHFRLNLKLVFYHTQTIYPPMSLCRCLIKQYLYSYTSLLAEIGSDTMLDRPSVLHDRHNVDLFTCFNIFENAQLSNTQEINTFLRSMVKLFENILYFVNKTTLATVYFNNQCLLYMGWYIDLSTGRLYSDLAIKPELKRNVHSKDCNTWSIHDSSSSSS